MRIGRADGASRCREGSVGGMLLVAAVVFVFVVVVVVVAGGGFAGVFGKAPRSKPRKQNPEPLVEAPLDLFEIVPERCQGFVFVAVVAAAAAALVRHPFVGGFETCSVASLRLRAVGVRDSASLGRNSFCFLWRTFFPGVFAVATAASSSFLGIRPFAAAVILRIAIFVVVVVVVTVVVAVVVAAAGGICGNHARTRPHVN